MTKRTKMMRPCDCIDSVMVSKLETQGISYNDDSLVVEPNYVILKVGHTTINIGMSRFRLFAEWYLTEQEVKL